MMDRQQSKKGETQVCPLNFFLEKYLELLSTNGRNWPQRPLNGQFDNRIRQALEIDDGAACVAAINGLITLHPLSTERVLELIDWKLSTIHPSSKTSSIAHYPRWLSNSLLHRKGLGYYAEIGDRRLIARGPLVGKSILPDSNYHDSPAERFTSLRVVPRSLWDENGIQHLVSHKEVQNRLVFGEVENVVFIPTATCVSHVDISLRMEGTREFMKVAAKPDSSNADTIMRVLSFVDRCTIAIAPEFSLSENEADKLKDLISNTTDHRPKLMVAGSGLTNSSSDCGRPWNEGQIFNEFGEELLRQRKMDPSQIHKNRLQQIGVHCTTAQPIEDTASGVGVSITDIPSFGRIAVLICHDIKIEPLVSELLTYYEPDWIFFPIFDTGFSNERWSAACAYSTAAAPTKIVGCTSMIWGVDGKHCGIVVVPSDTVLPERSVAYIKPEFSGSDCYGLLKWTPADTQWGKWRYSIE